MTTDFNDSIRTTCPYCGVGCGVIAKPKRGRQVEINGDPDHPANFGRLCSKGSALGETLGLTGRLLHPEIENHRTDWASALDLVAQEFSKAIREHGPDSVAFYVSGQILTEDYYVANKLMKGFIGSANIDTNSRLCMASSVAGHRKAFGSDTVPGVYADLEEADLIVLVGSNLAWCHPVLYQRIEAARQQRPDLKVVLIDPRRTMTANIADMHLAIEPDGDVALFSGLLVHLADAGRLDHSYIQRHTNGFDRCLEAARAVSASDVQSRTGLSAASLSAFYDLFTRTEKVVTVYSQGVNQSICGTDKVSAILNCHLATGRIGRPGMGPFSVTGQPNAMGGREVGGLANMLACHMDLENPDDRNRVRTFWNAPHMPEASGLKAVDMFKAVGEGRIKAIWIMSTNPVDSLPEADQVATALENCPFVVVSDILSDTDTMRYATVKLPASGWGEKEGTVTNSERRISRQRSFMEGPAEAMPDWWHMVQVAKRMGFSDAFDYTSAAEIFDEYARLSAHENDGSRDFDIGGLAGLSEEQYANLLPVQWPYTNGDSYAETRFFADGGFYTPDRKARFVSVDVPLAEEKPDFLLRLNTGRIRDQWHTMTRTGLSERLSRHFAEPFCEIHPLDAERIGVRSASLVNVESHLGRITLRALITDRVKAGSVFVPMHWTDQYASNARIDKLIPANLDPFSGQPASKNSKVSLSVANVGAFAFLITREKPEFAGKGISYWALAKCDGGWRSELAFASRLEAMIFGDQLAMDASQCHVLDYNDPVSNEHRFAAFDRKRLLTAFYMAPEPVQLSREWLVSQLQADFTTSKSRQRVLAGRADASMPEPGPIVCSCMGVGANQISAAIHAGATSVRSVGDVTLAGTNCGSCRAEIDGMINASIHQTKIAAE